MITHLELFNLKEWQEGNLRHLTAINDLQIAINKGSVLHLKQILRTAIHKLDASSAKEDKERCSKFRIILRNLPSLQAPYRVAPLRSRIGTDSTSHSGLRHGMGPVSYTHLDVYKRQILPAGRDANAIDAILETLAGGKDLTADMASAGFSALMDGAMTPSQAGSFLMGLRMKGESPLEMAHATRAALARAVRVDGIEGRCV